MHTKELASLISPQKFNHFYVPKFLDLCLDDVHEVRETTAKESTAAVLKNIAADADLLNSLLDQLKYFKDSSVYSHR